MKVVTVSLPDPPAYDADALARDVDLHRAEKMRGDAGCSLEAARAWLRAARGGEAAVHDADPVAVLSWDQTSARIAMNEIATQSMRPATYQDVVDAPPNMIAELANGRLHLQPRPASRHALAAFGLAGRLDDPFSRGVGGPGGWWLAYEPELHLGDDVLVPDLCGWRRERMPEFPDAAGIALAPDWVCEILSPGTRRFDTTEKRDLYGANGVGWLWHLDPAARTLEVFERRGGAWTLAAAVADADEVRCAPFEAIGFPLSALWAE